MSDWKLYCLGTPRLELSGAPVKLETRKALALLIYLRLNQRACSRAALEALLWPEYDAPHAQANLRRVLASLNTGPTRGLLSAERETVALRQPATLWLDVDAFQQTLSAACSGAVAPAALQTALDACRGDFLAGFYLKDCPAFEDWQSEQRLALGHSLAVGLQAAAQACAGRAQWDPALACARRWVALDPFHEPAQRLLIVLLDQSGQPQAARRQYDDLVRLLQDQRCQAPDPATRDLGRRLQAELEIRSVSGSAASPTALPATQPWREPLLKAKLYLPRTRANQVRRTRLVQQLQAVAAYPLTLVSAPAGFGKTTALLAWVEQTVMPVAWLSLDRDDNEPLRFLTYLSAALHSLPPAGGDPPPLPRNAPLSAWLAGLLDQIEQGAFAAPGEPFVLVLDDYQFITAQPVHEALSFLLDHLPGPLHLVIATRVDPPLPLARLRAAGQLLEVRADDLRFTASEAGAFLNQAMQLDLPSAEVDTLEERTEGWIAGLQMAALSLRNRPDHARLIRDFSGSHRYILDYLAEQVLDRLPAPLRKFLFQTSVLERLSGELCDAVTQVRSWSQDPWPQPEAMLPFQLDGQSILEYLEHANLFITPLDDDRRWYRYHHLFADLLRARLKQSEPGSVPLLQTRASEWYEQQGLVVEAVNYAHAARDYHRIARLVARNVIHLGASFQVYPLAQCIKLLPESMVFANPWFCILSAWDHVARARMPRAIPLLDAAEKGLRRDPRPASALEEWESLPAEARLAGAQPAGNTRELLGLIAALRANIAEAFDQLEETLLQAQQALDLLGPQAAIMRTSAGLMLARTACKQGDLSSARRRLEALLQHDLQAGMPTYFAIISVNLAALDKLEGCPHRAEARLRQAVDQVEQLGYQRIFASGLVYQWLADLLLDHASPGEADLRAAEQYACLGLQQNRHWGNLNAICQGLAILARLRLLQGDAPQASALLHEAGALDPDFTPSRDTLDLLDAVRRQLIQG